MIDTFEEIGNKANIVRNIELKAVLERTGCIKDKLDKAKWHTPEGVISVTCKKFMNWTKGTGGGGVNAVFLLLGKEKRYESTIRLDFAI